MSKSLNKQKGTSMKKIFRFISSILLISSFISCEVGLGKAVDVIAPTVNVISPDRSDYVQKTFIIEGVASDNIKVAAMTLQIQPFDNPTEETTMNFRISNQQWEKFVDGSWISYETANSSISGNSKKYNWRLEIDLDASVKTGTEYIVTTQVYDDGNNESKDSKDERAITIDMEEPVVSIISPSLKSYENEVASEYELKNNNILKNLMNGEFTISGSQKEDARLDYLVVYLDEKTDSSLNIETLESECTYFKKVTGDNLRNWSTTVDLSSISGFEHNRKTVRLITESHDKAGNIERKVQGWFTYWNDADKPWISAEFGGAAYSDNASVYPSCSLQGQAYDDDGLKEVIISIYKDDDTTPVKTQTLNLEADNFPTYKAWSVNALGENCKFRIEIQTTDINGIKSDIVKRYMKVTDTNPPKIFIETNTSIPMIGDANGNVKIEGYVTDDGGIETLKLLRIKTGTSADQLINYYNDSYSEWARVSPKGTTYVTSNGNKLWEIPLSEETIVNSEHKRTFSKTFNIFTDFGIDGINEVLTTQSFIIYTSDGSSSKIDSFSFAGDTEAPTISIDTLTVKNSNGTVKDSIDFKTYNSTGKSKKLQPFNKDSSGNITDKIILSGSWSDNSTDIWTDKTKKGVIKMNWEGLSRAVTITVDNAAQKWTTEAITPPDSTTAIISMDFTDFGGNVAKTNENFFISSSNPELMSISSEKNDGSYTAGTSIPIVLEFNKAVTFSGGTKDPQLKLNTPSGNEKIITYTRGNGTTKHVFEYIPSKGDDVAVLDVTQIITNGNTWIDADKNAVKSMAIPTNNNNKLKGSRAIKIDTVAPTFSSIKAISEAGSYNEGKEIFILADFTEDVKITNIEKIKLQLNETAYTSSTVQTGSNSVLFTYKVEKGHNFKPLKVSAISISGATITDAAGNPLISTTLPTCTGFSSINTDTVGPAKPTISGLVNNDIIYSEDGVSFTLEGIETGASVVKYSVDNGKSWTDYTGRVVLNTNGDYNITAYQQDAAGNKSDNAVNVHVNIDAGNILTSISAGIPTGTYTTGKVIPIYLNFRRDVYLDTASLSLNLSNGQVAEYESGSGTTQAKFNYTVQAGDFSEGLNVTQINGTFKDENNKIIDTYIKDIPEGKNLLNSRIIKIITDKPVIKKVSYGVVSGKNTLDVEFSTDITKGNGSITVTHDATTYKAPAILTTTQYSKYYGADSSIADYYSLGTNGSNANCISDLNEKYILNYEYDTNNGSLVSVLKGANADKVIVPVNSTYVSVVNKKTLRIVLDDTYKLPVKGAVYSIKFDADVVKDNQSNGNALNTSYTLTTTGIELPVIRINKANETITDINPKRNTATVTQPLQASVKIDCQTPDTTCYYKVNEQQNAVVALSGNSPNATTCNNAKPATITKANIQSGTVYSAATGLSIGSTTVTDAGFIYLIGAAAKKGTAWSDASYETAYRTSVVFENNNNTAFRYGGNMWIRGGDNIGGNVETKDFPFSWNSDDFSNIRAMTQVDAKNWYWVSWKLTTTSYVGFVMGNYPADAATNGPSDWCWGDCGFVPYKAFYPLLAGGSLKFTSNLDWGTYILLNQEKKCEYRDGDKVVKAIRTSAAATPTSTKTTEKGNSARSGYIIEVKFTKSTGSEYYIDLVNPNNESDYFDYIEYKDSDLVAGREYTIKFYSDDRWNADALKNSGVKVNGYGVNITSATITSLWTSADIPKADWQYQTGKAKLRITYKRKVENLPSYKMALYTIWGDGELLDEIPITTPTNNNNVTITVTSKSAWDNYSSAQWNGMKLWAYGLDIVSTQWVF